jgi:hypothetical protein
MKVINSKGTVGCKDKTWKQYLKKYFISFLKLTLGFEWVSKG